MCFTIGYTIQQNVQFDTVYSRTIWLKFSKIDINHQPINQPIDTYDSE